MIVSGCKAVGPFGKAGRPFSKWIVDGRRDDRAERRRRHVGAAGVGRLFRPAAQQRHGRGGRERLLLVLVGFGLFRFAITFALTFGQNRSPWVSDRGRTAAGAAGR